MMALNIAIPTDHGLVTVKATDEIGPFAVHHWPSVPPWHVTHIKTGLLLFVAETREIAVELAREACRLKVNWELDDGDEIVASSDEAARSYIRDMRRLHGWTK